MYSLETRPSPSSAIIITLTFEPYRSYGLDEFAHVISGTIDVTAVQVIT